MASQAEIRAVDNAIEAEYTLTASYADDLSWWDRVKIAIVPESYGEAMVNEIYGNGAARTLKPDPVYDERDLSSPNVYVSAKGAIKDTVSAVGSFATGGFIVIAGVFLVAIILYAAVPALILKR